MNSVNTRNYDPSATLPGYCEFHIPGCMDPGANNYLPIATIPFPFPVHSAGSASAARA